MLTIEDINRDWMPLADACKALGVSRTTIWRKCRAGILEATTYNHGVWVKRASIDRLLRLTFGIRAA